MRKNVIVVDIEDMHNDYPYASPKQYGIEVFEGTYSECLDELKRLREDYFSHGYSNMSIESRSDED